MKNYTKQIVENNAFFEKINNILKKVNIFDLENKYNNLNLLNTQLFNEELSLNNILSKKFQFELKNNQISLCLQDIYKNDNILLHSVEFNFDNYNQNDILSAIYSIKLVKKFKDFSINYNLSNILCAESENYVDFSFNGIYDISLNFSDLVFFKDSNNKDLFHFSKKENILSNKEIVNKFNDYFNIVEILLYEFNEESSLLLSNLIFESTEIQKEILDSFKLNYDLNLSSLNTFIKDFPNISIYSIDNDIYSKNLSNSLIKNK